MRLGVNIDHVASLRQQRKEGHPEPVYAALVAEAHGADSIVAHLREDRRHIQERDLKVLKQVLRIPVGLEMAATEDMERLAIEFLPARVCLVPERRLELTTEGGLNVISNRSRIAKLIARLASKKIEVSLFIDPDLDQVKCARSLGADIIELHTGRYANQSGAARQAELARLHRACDLALKLKLALHAGHGLDYRNVRPIARLPGMQELNIGFSIISRALFTGLGTAVREMKETIQ